MSQHLSALFVGAIDETLPALAQGTGEDVLPGYSLVFAATAEDALARLAGGDVDLLVFNMNAEEPAALDVLDRIEQDWPGLPVVAVSAPGAVKQAAQAIRKGACQVLIGPVVNIQLLQSAAECAIERTQVAMELRERLKGQEEQRTLEESLLDVCAALSSTLDYEEVLDLILDKMHLVLPHDAADITLIDGNEVRALRWHGYAQFGAVDHISSLDFALEEVRNYRTMRETRQPVAIPYVELYEGWLVCEESAWIKSYIGAPIIVEGVVIGFLGVCSATPGFFDAPDALRLKSFADRAAVAIRNARFHESSKQELAERKRTEIALQHQLMVEELISAVSTRFVQVDLEAFDPEMEKTLGSVGEFMAVDRCYLLFLSGVDKGNGADQYCVGSAYEWCLRGIEPSAQQMVGTLWSDLPWMLQRLFEGEIVRFDSVADVPSEADAERKLLDRNHVQSMLVIPLMQGGQLKGCFGVSMVRLARRWTDGDLRLLRLVGEVLFNAVARRQAEEALRGSEQKFRALAYENAGLLEQASKDAATKSTLLKEVNHRVKNNLTGIIGLLYAEQVRGSAKEVEGRSAILEEMTCRIQGMATVHSMLTATEWAPLSLDELVERVIRGTQQIASRRKQVFVNVPPCSVEVTPDEAHSLSMVINELATNSLKYATGEGISVSIEVQIAVENGTIHLLFRDDGEGYPASVLKDEHDSLGLYLVQNIVGRELSGQVEFATDRGAVTSIRFPSGVQKAAAQEV